MDYHEEIIKLIKSIHDDGKLEYLYTFIKLFINKYV